MFTADYRYTRPKKAEWLKTMYASPFVQRDDLTCWRGENATILPLRELREDHLLFGRAGVVDASGEYIAMSGIEDRIQYAYPFDNAPYVDKKVVYCGYLVNHWGHFLIEGVMRLWYFLENDASIDKYVFVLDENESRTISGNYRALFELLGLWDKLEFVNKPTTYREVVVPEMGIRVLKYWSPKMLRVFDTIAERAEASDNWVPKEKIFFTRSQFARGNGYEFGLEAMDNFFSKNGFTVLAPEKVPLAETIFYIRHASQIASISGSTPHNMLFARDGQNLIMMERLVMNDDCQLTINLVRQLQVTHVDANYHLYSVDWCGPYIVGYNHILERYIQDNHMLPPDPQFKSQAYLDKCVRQYLRSYHENYQFRWFMQDWYAVITDSIWEAYQDSYSTFHAFLDGKKPFLRTHYFQFHYFKQFIKRLLGINT